MVEFEHSVNAAVKRLRAALDDDADDPTFIETIPRRGYRFIAPVENGPLPSSAGVEKHLAPGLPSATVPEFWTRRRLVVAAVVAFLIVGALTAWRVRSARPKLTESDVILLATFVNKTGDPVFDNSLDKALEVKLSESPFLSVLPEADARSTMRMMRHDPNEPVTQELGIEICKRLGLKAVVVPEISAFGSKYLITLDAIDARNQKSIARRQAEAGSKDKVIAALGKAASQLRKQLGESLSSLEKYDAPLDLATTSSLEALQAYYDSPAGLSVCAKALADADDLPEASAVAAKLDRLFPEDTYHQKVYLPIIFSIIERKRGNAAKAVDLLAPITQYPNVLVFYYRAQAYLAAGEHAKAIDEFKTVIANPGWPDWPIFAPLAQLGLARVYAAQGNLENSRKAYNDLFTTWKDADPDIPILKQAQAEYSKLK